MIVDRHGDIEDVLAELLKRTGSGLLKQGSKFKGLDIKRVYFGYVFPYLSLSRTTIDILTEIGELLRPT